MLLTTTHAIRLSSSTIIGSGSDATVVVAPPPKFHLHRFLIDKTVAEKFLITGIAFDKNNQMLSPGAIPALLFSETGPHLSYDFDPNPTGDEIRISATNITRDSLAAYEVSP